MDLTAKFEKNTFSRRLKTMLHVDFRRTLTMPLFYLMAGTALVIPILVLVMTTMMDGMVSVNPQTGMETVIEGFDSTWQAIGSISGEGAMLDMSLTGMCNINLVYFLAAVYVCLFVAGDFRSGYAKNLFTVRAKKSDYVISKTLACFAAGAVMILAFFVGAMLGGAISGLSFDLGTADIGGVVMCMIAKVLLMGVFVPIYLLMSVIARQKTWLAMLLSFGTSMLLFTMIPMLTPLNSTIVNVVLCLAGSALFSAGLGAVSTRMLTGRDLL